MYIFSFLRWNVVEFSMLFSGSIWELSGAPPLISAFIRRGSGPLIEIKAFSSLFIVGLSWILIKILFIAETGHMLPSRNAVKITRTKTLIYFQFLSYSQNRPKIMKISISTSIRYYFRSKLAHRLHLGEFFASRTSHQQQFCNHRTAKSKSVNSTIHFSTSHFDCTIRYCINN